MKINTKQKQQEVINLISKFGNQKDIFDGNIKDVSDLIKDLDKSHTKKYKNRIKELNNNQKEIYNNCIAYIMQNKINIEQLKTRIFNI
jgi:RNA polymerase-interacting CarD/CdnL/TRCF family regulator